MKVKCIRYAMCCMLFLCSQMKFTFAFTVQHSILLEMPKTTSIQNVSKSSKTKLYLINNLFGNKKQQNSNDPNIPKRVFDIPVSSLKLGGTRFALSLFLIGQQATPVKGSWKVHPISDQVVDMYYVDDSAKFSMTLDETCISVDRYGSPSLQYLLQESVVLHRLLDEINAIATEGENVAAEKRLIVFLNEKTAISDARSKLPAKPAEAI